MAELFQFPEIKSDRDQIAMFGTPFPKRHADWIQSIANRFALKGKMEDLGSRTLIRDRNSALEVFHASDSLRWVQQSNRSGEASRKEGLPQEDRAIRLARTFLRARKLADKNASVKSVTYTILSRADKGQEAEDFPVALHVNFGFSLDSLPVFGPGAKMQVTFGSKDKVIGVYKFWRKPKESHVMKIIAPDAAAEILRKDQAYADLKESEAQVVFHRARLGYFALPPREAQGFLVPVYAFDGTVSTPYLKRYDFTKYVVAVQVTREELKRAGAIFRAPVDTF